MKKHSHPMIICNGNALLNSKVSTIEVQFGRFYSINDASISHFAPRYLCPNGGVIAHQ